VALRAPFVLLGALSAALAAVPTRDRELGLLTLATLPTLCFGGLWVGPDAPLLAVAKALDLHEFASTKHCALHGVVDVARAIELLKGPHSDSSPTSATIVGCSDAHGNPHHFALVWSRARAGRE
jgi:hypothetical protein